MTLGELVDTISAAAPRAGARSRRCRSADRSAPISRRRCSTCRSIMRAFAQNGGLIGHAGITVFDDSADMAHMARFAMEFCAIESCGKCTPCRIGSTRGRRDDGSIAGGKRGTDMTRGLAPDPQCEGRQAFGRARGRNPARSVRYHEIRIALRPWGVHALSGAERARLFPGRLRHGARASRGGGVASNGHGLAKSISAHRLHRRCRW
jgi:hypothetical protein